MKTRCSKTLYVLLLVMVGALSNTIAFAAPSCKVVAKISPDNQTVSAGSIVNGVFTPTVVQLNGQPSQDEDTYRWEQLEGPKVTLSNNSVDKPTFTAPNVFPNGAMLKFQLTVTGCSGSQTGSAVTTVQVSYVSQNQKPTALATAAPNPVDEAGKFTLDGTGSTDPDGNPLTYSWKQTAGPEALQGEWKEASLTLTAPPVPYPNGATLTFSLTVSDGYLEDSKDVNVTVKWVNDPPVAAVSCPSEVNELDLVELNGSGSSDNDDGIKSYEWSQFEGGPAAALPDGTDTADISFDAPQLTGSAFHTMNFKLRVTDWGGLFAEKTCDVLVKDITPPEISGASDITAEATSSSGTAVTFNLTAIDKVDGDVPVTCSPASGSVFKLGETPVECKASDTAQNIGYDRFTVTVVDTTPPELALPASPVIAEATGPSGAAVGFTATALDRVDGSVSPACTPASGSIFPLGDTTVNCTATDTRNNAANGSFTVTVQDTTPPRVVVPDDISIGPTGAKGAIVHYNSTSAADVVDGELPASCAPASGSLFGFGTTLVTCSATDSHHNTGSKSFSVTVNPFSFLGFFQPVDNLPALNTVKNGSTVPIKWKLQGQDGVEIRDVGAVSATSYSKMSCADYVGSETPIEVTTTGGTSLRYDPTAMQFIFNWQTPKTPGTCYRLDVVFSDGNKNSAYFKLK